MSPGLALGELGLQPNNLEVVVIVVGDIDNSREDGVCGMLRFRYLLPFSLGIDDE